MKNKPAKSDSVLLLNDSITTFLVPFEICKNDGFIAPGDDSIWEPSSIKIDRDAIHPHIQDFLIGNISLTDPKKVKEQSCFFYTLKDDKKESKPLLSSINYLFDTQTFCINGKQKTNKQLSFRFVNKKKSLASPKLILYPQASIGLLMLSVELVGEDCTIEDLVALNYSLQKIDSQEPLIKIVSTAESEVEEAYIEESKKSKEKTKARIADICQLLYSYKAITKTSKEKGETGWKLSSMITALLSDVSTKDIQLKLFNESRLHLITYLQIAEENNNSIQNFIRIIRCEGEKYQVLNEEQPFGKLHTRIFENIYVGSCVEGAAMMTVSNDESSNFFSAYKTNTYIARYLWIYLLVYIQKQTLIEIAKSFTQIETKKAYYSKTKLSNIISRLSMLKINSYFTYISDHTQHNSFYNFCMERLSIKTQLNEVKEKIEDISFLIKEQELIQNEIDTKNEKERNDKLQRIIAQLMIPQIYLALMLFFNIDVNLNLLFTQDCPWHYYLFCAAAIIVTGYVLIPIVKLFIFYRKS